MGWKKIRKEYDRYWTRIKEDDDDDSDYNDTADEDDDDNDYDDKNDDDKDDQDEYNGMALWQFLLSLVSL